VKKWGLFLILFLLPGWASAEDQSYRYLEGIEKKYQGLKDYTVDVKVHFDIETFKSPDLYGKLYYKAPDKMKIESKRVFFFPKEGAYFNPSAFRKEEFEIRLLERLTDESVKKIRLRLTPKKRKKNLQDVVLTIDVERSLVEEVKMSQSDERIITATLRYGTFDRLDLPIQVVLHFDMPNTESEGMRQFDQFVKGPKRVTGRIELTYSNYRVNSGLKDEIFGEADSPSSLNQIRQP